MAALPTYNFGPSTSIETFFLPSQDPLPLLARVVKVRLLLPFSDALRLSDFRVQILSLYCIEVNEVPEKYTVTATVAMPVSLPEPDDAPTPSSPSRIATTHLSVRLYRDDSVRCFAKPFLPLLPADVFPCMQEDDGGVRAGAGSLSAAELARIRAPVILVALSLIDGDYFPFIHTLNSLKDTLAEEDDEEEEVGK